MFGNADHTSTTAVSVTRFARIRKVIPTVHHPTAIGLNVLLIVE